MKNLLGNTSVPPYVKLMSAVLLTVTYLSILVYAGGYAVAHNWTLDGLPTMVTLVLGMGMSYALQTLNIHVGASVMESGPPHQIGSVQLAASTPVAATLVATPPAQQPAEPAKAETDGQPVG